MVEVELKEWGNSIGVILPIDKIREMGLKKGDRINFLGTKKDAEILELGYYSPKYTVDKELLNIYEDIIVKADILLGIFKVEKKKRGEFTYQRLSQANLEPANKSLENAKTFLKHIRRLCE